MASQTEFSSINPANDETVWFGNFAELQVSSAITSC